jgi:hypothetical protein
LSCRSCHRLVGCCRSCRCFRTARICVIIERATIILKWSQVK